MSSILLVCFWDMKGAYTPLHYAALEGVGEIVTLLLSDERVDPTLTAMV